MTTVDAAAAVAPFQIRRLDQRGRSYIALGPEQPAGREPAELIFAIEETQIRMSSSELPLERLLASAEKLVAA